MRHRRPGVVTPPLHNYRRPKVGIPTDRRLVSTNGPPCCPSARRRREAAFPASGAPASLSSAGNFAATKLLPVSIWVPNPPVRRLQVVYMSHNHSTHSVGGRESHAGYGTITASAFHVIELPFLLGAPSPKHPSGPTPMSVGVKPASVIPQSLRRC